MSATHMGSGLLALVACAPPVGWLLLERRRWRARTRASETAVAATRAELTAQLVGAEALRRALADASTAEARLTADLETAGRALASARFETGTLQTSARRADALAEAVRTLLPVLAAQLANVNQQTEEAALQIGGRAHDVAQATQQHGERARALHEAIVAEDHGVAAVLGQGVDALGRVVESTVARLAESHAAVESARSLTDRLAGVASLTRDIQRVAWQTRIVSLNAAIEAARAGEHGRGFGVVADEVRALADGIAAAAAQVAGLVDAVDTAGIARLASLIESDGAEGASTSGQLVEAQRLAAEMRLNLARTTEAMRDAIADVRASEADVQRSVLIVVTSLQFQDATRQQIEHVISALGQLQASAGPQGDDEAAEDVGARLRAIYTSESERRLHDAVVEGADTHAPLQLVACGAPDGDDDLGDNVTLF
jgi:methyl-accepting chemotaxis protein